MHEVNFELVGERIKLKRKAKKLTQDADSVAFVTVNGIKYDKE